MNGVILVRLKVWERQAGQVVIHLYQFGATAQPRYRHAFVLQEAIARPREKKLEATF